MKTFYPASLSIISAFLVLLIASSTSIAQNVGISNNPAYTPYSKAILDLDKSGGLLPPRLTNAERNTLSGSFPTAATAEGMMIYNTTTDRYEMWVYDTPTTSWMWKKVVNEDDLGGGAYILNQTTQQASSNFNISNAGVIGTTLGVGAAATIGTTLSVGNGITVGAVGTPGNILMSIDDSWIGTGTGTTGTRIEFDKTAGTESVTLFVNKPSLNYTAMTIKNDGAAAGVGLKLSGIRNLGGEPTGYIDFENQDVTTDLLARVAVKNSSADNSNGSFHISLRSANAMVNDRLVLDNAGNLTITGKFNSQGVKETSDARFKKNINSITNALATVINLEGVTYNWRSEEFPDRSFGTQMEYGVIAQQIEKFVPELVSTDENGYKSVQYSHMVPLLLEAIKEQQNIINNQSQELGILKASVEAISEHIKTAEK